VTNIPPDFAPIEDLLLGIFHRWFDGMGIHVASQFSEEMPIPAVIARADLRSGMQAFHSGSDDRFTRAVPVSISVFSNGPAGNGLDADKTAAQLGESVTLCLRTAYMEQWVVSHAGHITALDQASIFVRKTDWQTSTNVVQYASLPEGLVRYESIYRIMFRPPVEGSNNPFLPSL
jgi:hypothetical protein